MLAGGLTTEECSTRDLRGSLQPGLPCTCKEVCPGDKSGALSARTGEMDYGDAVSSLSCCRAGKVAQGFETTGREQAAREKLGSPLVS